MKIPQAVLNWTLNNVNFLLAKALHRLESLLGQNGPSKNTVYLCLPQRRIVVLKLVQFAPTGLTLGWPLGWIQTSAGAGEGQKPPDKSLDCTLAASSL